MLKFNWQNKFNCLARSQETNLLALLHVILNNSRLTILNYNLYIKTWLVKWYYFIITRRQRSITISVLDTLQTQKVACQHTVTACTHTDNQSEWHPSTCCKNNYSRLCQMFFSAFYQSNYVKGACSAWLMINHCAYLLLGTIQRDLSRLFPSQTVGPPGGTHFTLTLSYLEQAWHKWPQLLLQSIHSSLCYNMHIAVTLTKTTLLYCNK